MHSIRLGSLCLHCDGKVERDVEDTKYEESGDHRQLTFGLFIYLVTHPPFYFQNRAGDICRPSMKHKHWKCCWDNWKHRAPRDLQDTKIWREISRSLMQRVFVVVTLITSLVFVGWFFGRRLSHWALNAKRLAQQSNDGTKSSRFIMPYLTKPFQCSV